MLIQAYMTSVLPAWSLICCVPLGDLLTSLCSRFPNCETGLVSTCRPEWKKQGLGKIFNMKNICIIQFAHQNINGGDLLGVIFVSSLIAYVIFLNFL